MANEFIRFQNRINSECTHGYAAGFGFVNGLPTKMSITFDPEWLLKYQSEGLGVADPVILWGMENQGHKSWSELAKLGYSTDVFDKARNFGMENGTVIAVCQNHVRSIIGITHKEETASPELIALVYGEMMLESSGLEMEKPEPTNGLEYLRLVTQGLTEPQVAQKLGKSVQAIRLRRKKVMRDYGALTVSQAVKNAMLRNDL